MPSLFFCGFGSAVGFLDGVSGSFTLPYQNCGDAPAPPHPPAWGGCPRTPQKNQRLFLFPPFAPSPFATRAHPGPAPPPVVLPAAVRAIFLYRRRCFLRFLPSAPLAPSPNEKNGPQSRFLPFCPRRPRFALPPTEPRAKEKAPESGGFPLRKKLHLQQLF